MMVVWLAALAIAAQDAPPVFEAGTDLVTVDVVVVDKTGRPVEGLTQADFKLLENGQARELVTFEAVRVPEAPAQPTAATRRAVSTNAAPPPARTFVIVFDELHLGPPAVGRAKAAIRKFLTEQTRPGDRVTLVPTAGGRAWTDSTPEGRDDLLALLESLTSRTRSTAGPDHVTDWEAMRIFAHRDDAVAATVQRRFMENGAIQECIPPPGASACSEVQRSIEGQPQVFARAASVYHESLGLRRTTLRAVEAALDSLVGTRGRKALLLVSEGLVHEPTQADLHEVYEAARRANTAVYFVDARGLQTAESTVLEQGRSTQDQGSRSSKLSNDLALALDQPRLLAEGTEALAEQTGGESFKNSNDIGRGFERLARESTSYYLVGYAPLDLKRDGKFRKIQVQVGRPGVEVRARRGYVVPRDSDLQGKSAATQPNPSVDTSALPLRVAVYTLEETNGKLRVLVAGEADPSVFGWETRGDRFEDALDTTLNLVPRSAAPSHTDSRLVELAVPAPARAQIERDWIPIVREVQLEPGAYQAQLAVHERNRGLAGWVRHSFDVPAAGTFRLTSPILTDVLPTDQPGVPRLAPLARRSFARGAKVYLQFEVLNPGRDAQSAPKLRASHLLRKLDGPALPPPEPSPLAPSADGKLLRTLAISLRTATPGPHELVLRVYDDVTGHTLEQKETFEVTDAEIAEAAPAAPAATAAASATVDPRAALEHAERQARAGGPQARRWAVVAALMLDAQGRRNDAASRLESLAKQTPADADALIALGAVEEARIAALANMPVEAAPAGSEQLPQFQRLAARVSALKQAEGRYRAALAARPDDAEAHLRLGRVLQLRKEKEAVEHLQQAARLGSPETQSVAQLFLGEEREAAGRLPDAIAAYRLACAVPQAQAARIALGQALLRSGDATGARETIEKGLTDAAAGLDPYLAYTRPALPLGTRLIARLEQEGTR